MAKTQKTAESPKPDDLPFEEALRRLESVVEAMESGELPLEELLARYEEGMKLAASCQRRLTDAELRIQQLEQAAGGEFKLKPLERTDNEEC